MSKTLLEIVQDILNDTDGEEVNSIDDTLEAEQCAYIVRSTFDAMMTSRDWPHTRKLIQLSTDSNTATPTHMFIADSVKKLVFINYNKQKADTTKKIYQPVKYKHPDEFLRMLNNRNNDATNVDVIQDPTGVELLIVNDKHPEYYTSFDDKYLVFDSYDSDVNDTLISSKTQCMAYVIPTLTIADDTVPDLPDEAFPYLIEESKSRFSAKLRQIPDQKSEQESVRQNRFLSRNSFAVKGGIRYPNYGRK